MASESSFIISCAPCAGPRSTARESYAQAAPRQSVPLDHSLRPGTHSLSTGASPPSAPTLEQPGYCPSSWYFEGHLTSSSSARKPPLSRS